jgi:hypothetical protein
MNPQDDRTNYVIGNPIDIGLDLAFPYNLVSITPFEEGEAMGLPRAV